MARKTLAERLRPSPAGSPVTRRLVAVLLAVYLLGCPGVGDPHFETGFRLGPLSAADASLVLEDVCARAGTAALIRERFIWGEPAYAVEDGTACRETQVHACAARDDLFVSVKVCGAQKHFIDAFFAGLEGAFTDHRHTVCAALATQLDVALRAMDDDSGDPLVRWWSRQPRFRITNLAGCEARTSGS